MLIANPSAFNQLRSPPLSRLVFHLVFFPPLLRPTLFFERSKNAARACAARHDPRVDSQFGPQFFFRGVSFCQLETAAAIEPKIEKKEEKKKKEEREGTRERKVAEGEDWLGLKGRGRRKKMGWVEKYIERLQIDVTRRLNPYNPSRYVFIYTWA